MRCLLFSTQPRAFGRSDAVPVLFLSCSLCCCSLLLRHCGTAGQCGTLWGIASYITMGHVSGGEDLQRVTP